MHLTSDSASPRNLYNLLIGLVAPRPIAWVTSRGAKGQLNAAPFSAYNYLCTDPPIVGIGVAGRPGRGDVVLKDTARNIQETPEFVINVVTEDLAQQMNLCAADFPPEVNELEMAGLNTAPSKLISVPRIAQAHAALECRLFQTIPVGRSQIILGQVVAFYVEDRFIDPAGPYIRAEDLHAIGRMNGLGNYVRTRDAFLDIPRVSREEWEASKHADKHP